MIEETHFNLQLTCSFYKYIGKEAKYVETRTEDKASIDRIDAKLGEGLSNDAHSLRWYIIVTLCHNSTVVMSR